MFRSGLRALLEQEEDFQVVGETGDGFATIREAERLDFDVLLLDISMPGLSGPQVAEGVLEAKPGRSIVVLTMHEDEYYVREMFRIDVRAFVLKKSTGHDLVQAIQAAHRGERYIDPAVADHVIGHFIGRQKPGDSRIDALTRRELEVCRLVAHGYTNAEVGSKLSISERTVEGHRTKIMGKLSLRSRAELVRFALDNGLLGSAGEAA